MQGTLRHPTTAATGAFYQTRPWDGSPLCIARLETTFLVKPQSTQRKQQSPNITSI
jgi:hypothetical protein